MRLVWSHVSESLVVFSLFIVQVLMSVSRGWVSVPCGNKQSQKLRGLIQEKDAFLAPTACSAGVKGLGEYPAYYSGLSGTQAAESHPAVCAHTGRAWGVCAVVLKVLACRWHPSFVSLLIFHWPERLLLRPRPHCGAGTATCWNHWLNGTQGPSGR